MRIGIRMNLSEIRMNLSDMSRVAHLNIDDANDFADPRGSLYVQGGERTIPFANRITQSVRSRGGRNVFSRDWHHPESVHFAAQGGPWPPHCVQNTWGAEFHPELDTVGGVILSKGTGRNEDILDPFDVNAYIEHDGRILDRYLRDNGIRVLIVTGLATDYCDHAAVLSAVRLGYLVYLVTDAIAAVDITPGDGQCALDEMLSAGAMLVTTDDIVSAIEGS